LESVPESGKSTIADFYVSDLAPFFARQRHRVYHLLESRIPLNRLQTRIAELNRFLNQAERDRMARIAAYVREKDGLDYHYALQSMLKIWLFTHIPLTYGLLILAVLHLLLVTAFSGGARWRINSLRRISTAASTNDPIWSGNAGRLHQGSVADSARGRKENAGLVLNANPLLKPPPAKPKAGSDAPARLNRADLVKLVLSPMGVAAEKFQNASPFDLSGRNELSS
jgi:hypothetical protein